MRTSIVSFRLVLLVLLAFSPRAWAQGAVFEPGPGPEPEPVAVATQDPMIAAEAALAASPAPATSVSDTFRVTSKVCVSVVSGEAHGAPPNCTTTEGGWAANKRHQLGDGVESLEFVSYEVFGEVADGETDPEEGAELEGEAEDLAGRVILRIGDRLYMRSAEEGGEPTVLSNEEEAFLRGDFEPLDVALSRLRDCQAHPTEPCPWVRELLRADDLLGFLAAPDPAPDPATDPATDPTTWVLEIRSADSPLAYFGTLDIEPDGAIQLEASSVSSSESPLSSDQQMLVSTEITITFERTTS